jgi:hypothetical protein
MIAFDVFCNDTFLCRMGLPDLQSVLSLTLSSQPQQDSASLMGIGKTNMKPDAPTPQSEPEKLAYFKAQLQKAVPMWLAETLSPPFQLEIRVIETDDVDSISEYESMSADPAAVDPRVLNLFATNPSN